jgi:thiosulfate dehydrogenase
LGNNDKYLNRNPQKREETERPRRARSGGFGGFLFGVFIGLCLPVGLLAYLLAEGKIPVGAKAPPLPFEKLIARKIIRSAMKEAWVLQPTVVADEPNLLDGVKIYKQNCALCHGLPDEKTPSLALGLYPPAPQLYQQHQGVDDDPVSETFWKVRNGLRMTGMPAFQDTLSDSDIWKVSLLLANGMKIPPPVRAALNREPTPTATPVPTPQPTAAPTPLPTPQASPTPIVKKVAKPGAKLHR